MSDVQNAILYFLTQPGCAHCALARPIVDEYRRSQLGKVFVYELDVHRHPQIDDWQPKGTPAFALKVNGILMATSEGSMSLAQIDRFVQRGAAGKETYDEDRPSRRRRRTAQGRRKASGADRDQGQEHERGSSDRADDAGDDPLDDGDSGASRASSD